MGERLLDLGYQLRRFFRAARTDLGSNRRCCTALAESEIRLWWWRDREHCCVRTDGVTRSRRNPSPRFANTDSSTSSVGGGGQCIRQGSGLRSHRSAQSWTKDARGDSAATKRDAQSEFEHRHAGARSPYSCNRKTRPTRMVQALRLHQAKHGGERGLSLQGDHRAGDAGSNVGEATS